MATSNPRNTISFDEIRSQRDTYIIDNSTITYSATATGGSASVGLAVTLSADKTVALCADGDPILGKLILVESDNKCAIQTEGYCTLPGGASATLTAGAKIVGALGASSAKGYIRAVAATTGSYVQGTANDALKGAHKIIDATTTTAVVVKLT